MNRKTTAALAIVAIALFAWITMFERHTLSSGEVEGRRARLVERFVRARVDRLELEREDHATVVLSYTRPDDGTVGDWRMLEPLETAADEDAVGALLGLLEWSDARRTLENVSAEDRERFGLDQPRITARLVMDGETLELEVGADEASGGGVYVTVDGGQTVAIAGRDVFEGLDHDAGHFRSKRLLERGVLTADRVTLTSSEGERILTKDGERWMVGGRLASQGAVDEILQTLTDLEAERFVEAATDTPTLDARASRPAGADEANAEEGTERVDVHLEVFGECPGHTSERVARMSVNGAGSGASGAGATVCVLASSLEPLQRDAEALQEMRPITLSDLELESLSLSRDGSTLDVSRDDDGGWQYRWGGAISGVTGAVDEQALSDWLRDLRRARATSIRAQGPSALAAYGLSPPVATLVIEATGERREELQVGALTTEGLFVRRGDEPAVLVLPASAAELLTPSPARLRPRQLTDAEEPDVKALSIQRGATTERFERDAADWRIVAPLEAPADRSAVREALRKLASLRALRFAADAPSPEHGLDSPRFVIRMRIEREGSEARDVTLRIGSDTEDGAFARLEGEPGIFVVSPALVDSLQGPLVSRDLLATPSYELEGITIETDARTLALRQDGGRFVTDDGPADEERTSDLTQAISRFRARDATAYGPPAPADGLTPPRARIRVQRAEGADPPVSYEILVGAPDGEGMVHVRRADLAVGLRVEEAVIDAVLAYEP